MVGVKSEAEREAAEAERWAVEERWAEAEEELSC